MLGCKTGSPYHQSKQGGSQQVSNLSPGLGNDAHPKSHTRGILESLKIKLSYSNSQESLRTWHIPLELLSETTHLYSGFKLYSCPELTGGQQNTSFQPDVVGIWLFRQQSQPAHQELHCTQPRIQRGKAIILATATTLPFPPSQQRPALYQCTGVHLIAHVWETARPQICHPH